MTNSSETPASPAPPQAHRSKGVFDKVRDTAHHTLYFGISSVLGRSLNFLLLPVYTHYLSRDEYGALSILLLVQAFLSLLPEGVFILPVFRSFYNYEDDDRRSLAVSTSFWLIAAVTFLLCGAGWVFAAPVSKGVLLPLDYIGSLQLVFLACFAECVGLSSLAVFRARKWSRSYAVVASISMLVQAALAVLFVVHYNLGVWGVCLSIVIGIALRTLIGIAMTLDAVRLRFSLREARSIVAYGFPLLPGSVLTFFNRSSDRWFVTLFLDLGAQGVYSVGLRFAQIVSILIFTPFNLMRPAAIFSAEKDHDSGEFYAKMLTYLLFLGVFLSLCVSALAKEALHLMTSPDYYDAWRVIPLLCLSYLFAGIRLSLSPGLILQGRTTLMSIAEALGTVANLILMFTLVPRFGNVGAAVAVAITCLVTCIALVLFNLRSLPVPWEWGRLVKLFALAPALYLIALFLPIHSLALSILVKTLLCLSFPFLLALIGFYQPAEIHQLRLVVYSVLLRFYRLRARFQRK